MLGSGMLSQSRVLSGISNNIANVNTTGYKKEKVTTTTFGDMVMCRLDEQGITSIGNVSMMRIADEMHVLHTQGTLKETGRNLDFAIEGEGFFGIQTANGLRYTRNGSFSLDEQGYLVLEGMGRVQGQNGDILLGTDDITADSEGNLYRNGVNVDSLSIVNFADYGLLQTDGEGLYDAGGAAAELMNTPSLYWQMLEGSNVDAAEEMTNALTVQRQIQAISQALQMYDQTLGKAVAQIGRVSV